MKTTLFQLVLWPILNKPDQGSVGVQDLKHIFELKKQERDASASLAAVSEL